MSALPSARFPRLERQGFLLGLGGSQVAVCAIAVLLLLKAVSSTDLKQMLVTLFFVAGPVAAFGAMSFQRRALTTMTWEMVVWMVRRGLGQTEFKIRPETPTSKMAFGLPGAAGSRISVHGTGFAGGSAMLWDARDRTATAVLQCQGSSFPLASEEDRAARATAWAKLCAQVVKHEGVVRVATYARTVPAAAAGIRDYYAKTTSLRGAGQDASVWADEQYQRLLASQEISSQAVVSRDVLLTVTVSAVTARAMIKAAGGGKRGMSYVLAREVDAISALLTGTGVDSVRWLDAAGVGEAVRVAFDPGAVEAVETRRMQGEGAPVSPPSAGPTLVVEHADHLETDSALHRTYWVAEWPRTEVEVGFLEPVICSGSYPHTFTQVFTPEPVHKALKDIRKAQVGASSQMTVQEKLGRPITAEMHATAQDLADRELEISEGFGGVRFTGYLTVSGVDEEALASAAAKAQMAAAHVDLRLLKRQQAAAFTAAMLPVGWGLK